MKTRITVDLNAHDYARLERLEGMLEAGSKIEVIREALKLYGFVAQHIAEGSTLTTVKPDGTRETRETLVILGLPGPT
jgi:DNA-binding transcriptional MerR regulator